MLWVVIVLVFALVLWGVVEVAAVAGFLGVLSGEKLERCSHCHQYGLTSDGIMHPHGCPDGIAAHLAHLMRSFGHLLHFDSLHLQH